MRLASFVGIFLLFKARLLVNAVDEGHLGTLNNSFPVVVVTWNYTSATEKTWDVIYNQKRSALDAIEEGCSLCEEQQCRKTVGYGGKPDESGETTLDAFIMDGDDGRWWSRRDAGDKKRYFARKVMEHTKHSLLGGNLAADFAVSMGFKKESLQTDDSKEEWLKWKANNCQPNFWKNVVPDPSTSCGPYRPSDTENEGTTPVGSEENHDTIAILAIDSQGRIATGASSNGARNKMHGRIGDSSIVGAGAYADQEVGAAAVTGDGDILMRFLPSFLAVEEMRHGASPSEAARNVVNRIAPHYPNFLGGVIALNKKGEYGAACNGMTEFPYYVANPTLGPKLLSVPCNSCPQCDKEEIC